MSKEPVHRSRRVLTACWEGVEMEKIYDCGSHVRIQGGPDDDIYVVGRTHGYAKGLCLTLEGHAYLLAENCRVEAGDWSEVVSMNGTKARLMSNAKGYFQDTSTGVLCGRSTAFAKGRTVLHVDDEGHVVATEDAHIIAAGDAYVEATGCATVIAQGRTEVTALDQVCVHAYDEVFIMAGPQCVVYIHNDTVRVVGGIQIHVKEELQ